MESFIRLNFESLQAWLGFRWPRPPSYTTLRNHIQGVSTASLEQVFRRFTEQLAQARSCRGKELFMAIDGKTLRGSRDDASGKAADQVLSLYDIGNRLIRGHFQIREKTNEIPLAQGVIMEYKTTQRITFTLDALHCQQKTFQAATARHQRLITQLKANQPELLREVGWIIQREKARDRYREPLEKKHGRIEQRIVRVFTPELKDYLMDPIWREQIKSLIQVERKVQRWQGRSQIWKDTSQTAIYLSNEPLSASLACQAIRQHWHIENAHHYVRDVTFMEDQQRVRIKSLNLAILRSFVINIFRHNQITNLKQERYENSCCWHRIKNYQMII